MVSKKLSFWFLYPKCPAKRHAIPLFTIGYRFTLKFVYTNIKNRVEKVVLPRPEGRGFARAKGIRFWLVADGC